MMHTTYASGGLCRRPSRRDLLDGLTELLLYNPAERASTVTMTAYFEQREPQRFTPFELAAQTNVVLVAPTMDPIVFDDCGFWGARFESSTPLIAVLISLVGELGNPCPDPLLQGGATHFLGTGLHTQWHFADGVWRDRTRAADGVPVRNATPANELEYYYFLNPGPHDAMVELTLQYRNLAPTTTHIAIPAGRVRAWCNFERVHCNQPYGVRVRATQPLTTTAVRYNYGLNGFDDRGLTIRMGIAAEPGPITD